jgi:type 1 glutamine amidotransferase
MKRPEVIPCVLSVGTTIIVRMNTTLPALAIALLMTASASGQTAGQTPPPSQSPTPGQIDGRGGPRATAQKRPPDNRRPRGTAVALLGWKAGIRSDAFGAIPFIQAAERTDAAGIAFIEAVSSNLDYTLGADELAKIKARLADLGLRVPAYRLAAIPADEASRRKLLEFAKALEIELVLTREAPAAAAAKDLAGITVAVEDSRGLYKQGDKTVGANLGDAKNAGPLLLELSKQQPPERPEWPNKCGDCGTSRPSVRPLFFTITPGSAENYDRAVRGAEGYRVNEISRMMPITTTDRIPAEEKQKIDAAIPRQALAKPSRARKLLIVDVCPAGGFYHTTIAHGNLMLELIAKYTGAYEPVFDNNLDNLKYPRIKQYDAVFLNSVVGPVFADPEVLDGLIRYVREGGGVAGLHGTTFASQDLREFGELMGAQEGPHQYNGEPGTLKIDDPTSPLTRHFGGKGFSMMDEFYHFPPTGPYTREKLHVLLSVDADKTGLKRWEHIRPDRDYGMAWIKREGKGRVFNMVLGHRPEFYMHADLMKLMVGGIQFVLGDLEADATPSAKLK